MKSKFSESAIALTASTLVGFTALPAQSALLVGSGGDNSIKQYDEITGAYIRDFVTSGSGGLLNPGSFAVGGNGNLFVSSGGTNSIKEYSGTTGEYIGDLTNSSGGLIAAGNLAAKDNSLFVVTTRIPGSERDAGIGFGLVTFDSGVVEYDINTGVQVKSIGARTSSSGPIIPTGPQPVDVAIGGPNNNLFLSSSSARFNSGSIAEYDTTTGQTVGGGPVAVSFASPQSITVSDSTVYYTDFISSDFSQINYYDIETGLGNLSNISQPFINDSELLNSSLSLAVGGNGNLLVGVSGTNSVRRYDGETGDFLGDLVSAGSGGLSNPTYVTTANVPVPEPSSVLGVLALGGLFAGGAVRRKRLAKFQK